MTKANNIQDLITRVLNTKGIDIDALKDKPIEEIIQKISIYQEELEFQNRELVRIQDRLSKSEKQFATLFYDAPVGYVVFDSDRKIVNVNHAFESLIGKNKNLIMGTRITQYIHPDYQDSFYLHFKTLNRLEHSESIELALLNTQNSKIFVKIQCSRDEVIDNDNEASKLIRMSVTDISGLKEKEAALAKSYQLLNDLAVQSKTFAWEVDANGLYTYVSPIITEVLGYHPSELEYKLH
ncbi:MAG: PAS domain-containing protein [Chitinophagaceae bacterium]